MTKKRDKCVDSSNHVISDDHVIGSDHMTNVISNDVTDHVITSKVINGVSSTVHIILSVDKEHLQGFSKAPPIIIYFCFIGLVTTMNSLLKHSLNPALLHFHIVIAGQPIKLLESYLQCHHLLLPGQVEVKQLNSDWLDGQITVHSSKQLVGNLASQANFARFFFHR